MTVVFFCPNVLRDAHKYIFQLDRLKEEGFNIILLDATKFYGRSSTATEKIILENKVECIKEEDFIEFRKNLPNTAVLFITFDLYVTFAEPILNILIRKKDKLLTYHTKRFSSVNLPSNKIRLTLDKLAIYFDKLFPLHYFNFFYKWKYKMYIPDYYLCSTSFLIPTKIYFTIKKENRIIVHADEINQTLNSKKSTIIDKNKRVGVFLDQVMPFQHLTHPKLLKDPAPEGYCEMYYENIENILTELKLKLNLDEIIIAWHPDAKKFENELSDKFLNFRSFIGFTHELIKDANLIIGHTSAAFGYAIYYKKPVLILRDSYLEKIVGHFLSFFTKELDMKSITFQDSQAINFSEISINEKKYNDYISKYLKDNDIQENSYFHAIKRIQNDMQN